jgi:hypothetical protein
MTPFLIEMGHPSLVIRWAWAAPPCLPRLRG